MGFGVVRDCLSGRKVGPLFADDEEAAIDLLGVLLSRKPDRHHYLDLPDLPGHGRSLVTDAASEAERPFVYLHPKAGTVLMWESWLRHEVPTNQAKSDRISISFEPCTCGSRS